jgi:hypothetical protein
MKFIILGLLISFNACVKGKPQPPELPAAPGLQDTLPVPQLFLKDTFPFYQAFAGRLGKDSVKLHLFKNRYYEHTFTATLYEVTGEFFKLFQGETHFQQQKEGYLHSYNAGRMNSEIDYRYQHPVNYDQEVIELRECSMDFANRWELSLQLTATGGLNGEWTVENQPKSKVTLQPIKSDGSFQYWSCRNATTTLDVALPFQLDQLKALCPTKSVTRFKNPLLQRLQRQVQQQSNDQSRNFSVSCMYQEQPYLTVGVQQFWLKGKRGGYLYQTFNYDTARQKIIELNDVLTPKEMTRLNQLIRQRQPKDMQLDKRQFVLMKQGILLMLTPVASYERDMGHVQGFFFKWDELK